MLHCMVVKDTTKPERESIIDSEICTAIRSPQRDAERGASEQARARAGDANVDWGGWV